MNTKNTTSKRKKAAGEPVKLQAVSHRQVFDALTAMVESGRVKDRIPQLEEVAAEVFSREQVQLSTKTVSRAWKRLEEKGLIKKVLRIPALEKSA